MPTNLAQARQELEQLVLLESVAEGREERIRTYLRHLVDDFGFEPDDLARRLGVSHESMESLLSTTQPSTVADKLELSDESIRDLLTDRKIRSSFVMGYRGEHWHSRDRRFG